MPTINESVSVATTYTVGLDDTLTVQGKAADAKATGDAIAARASVASVNGEASTRASEITRVEGLITALKTGGVGNTIAAIAENIFNTKMATIYPVGGVYVSFANTNPATVFGFGTWESIGRKVLLGADADHEAGVTGGSESYAHSHTCGGHTLTADELPAHTHGNKVLGGAFAIKSDVASFDKGLVTTAISEISTAGFIKTTSVNTKRNKCNGVVSSSSEYDNGISINASHEHETVGQNVAHSHDVASVSVSSMPPYITCWIWKRVA